MTSSTNRELEAENEALKRMLNAEQDAHARFVRRISAALGEYTGSYEDACIARLSEHEELRRAWAKDKQRTEAAEARVEELSDALREIASFLGNGGYNAPDPIDATEFVAKAMDGIDHVIGRSAALQAKNDELRREVHRLKGDVHGAGIAGELAGAAKERAAVVAWLRTGGSVWHFGAELIEAGEHMKGGGV
jgi:DNA repair exonuclease SbcCD ATPase subunit